MCFKNAYAHSAILEDEKTYGPCKKKKKKLGAGI